MAARTVALGMTRSILCLTVLAGLAWAAAVQAAEVRRGMEWVFEGGRLAFGVPGTEDGLAIFDCVAEPRAVRISHWVDAAPQGARVTLGSGRLRSHYRARVEPNDISEGVVLRTDVKMGDPVLGRLEAGRPMSIDVAGDRTTLPPLPKELAAQFFGSCRK
jgi:hypothetical protein